MSKYIVYNLLFQTVFSSSLVYTEQSLYPMLDISMFDIHHVDINRQNKTNIDVKIRERWSGEVICHHSIIYDLKGSHG